MIVRKIISAIIVMNIVFSTMIVCEANDDEISVFVDGNRLAFDVPPIIINDRALVPMRIIFEELGFSVDWNEPRQRVTAVKGELSVQLDIGDTLVILNDYESAVELDVPAQIIDGRTMVPLRFVAEVANYDVLWDGSSRTVYIEPLFDGEGAVRPYQSVAMYDDKLVWTNGMMFSHDGRIFAEVEYANSNSLQVYDGYLYYRSSEFLLCRANIETDEIETIITFPVADTLIAGDKIYYTKMGDTSHVLFQSDLDGNNETLIINEPIGDYRIMNGIICYIHMHSYALKQVVLATGETRTLYDGFTTCLDVSSDGKVYYGMAEYKDEMTPLAFKGIGCFDYSTDSNQPVVGMEQIKATDLWILGDNLFYETYQNESYDGQYDLYRYSFRHGYNLKILSEIFGSTEIHGKRIFYYPIYNEFPQAKGGGLYIANTRGTNGFPLVSLVFSTIALYGIDENKPDDSVFDEYLNRDISAFVLEKYATEKFDYILLTKTAEGDMNGGCRYYVWINIYAEDSSLLESGVLSVRAENKEKFVTESLRTKDNIASEKVNINSFPKVIRKRILELAEL